MRRLQGSAWLHGLAAISLLAGAAMAVAQEPKGGTKMETKADSVAIRWWGQACWSLTAPDGKCVLVDPFPANFGYSSPTAEPQVCLVTHEHRDHNAVENVKGSPKVIRGVGAHEAAGMKFVGVATFHDDAQGAKRGPNTVFAWEMGGIRFAHLGDLGHLLSPQQVQQIGAADVIMIPVGGYYTIDARQAVEVARQLSAKVVLPMHYKTADVPRLPIAGIDDFLGAVPKEWQVEKPTAPLLSLSLGDLPREGAKAIVLPYE